MKNYRNDRSGGMTGSRVEKTAGKEKTCQPQPKRWFTA